MDNAYICLFTKIPYKTFYKIEKIKTNIMNDKLQKDVIR